MCRLTFKAVKYICGHSKNMVGDDPALACRALLDYLQQQMFTDQLLEDVWYVFSRSGCQGKCDPLRYNPFECDECLANESAEDARLIDHSVNEPARELPSKGKERVPAGEPNALRGQSVRQDSARRPRSDSAPPAACSPVEVPRVVRDALRVENMRNAPASGQGRLLAQESLYQESPNQESPAHARRMRAPAYPAQTADPAQAAYTKQAPAMRPAAADVYAPVQQDRAGDQESLGQEPALARRMRVPVYSAQTGDPARAVYSVQAAYPAPQSTHATQAVYTTQAPAMRPVADAHAPIQQDRAGEMYELHGSGWQVHQAPGHISNRVLAEVEQRLINEGLRRNCLLPAGGYSNDDSGLDKLYRDYGLTELPEDIKPRYGSFYSNGVGHVIFSRERSYHRYIEAEGKVQMFRDPAATLRQFPVYTIRCV